MNQSIIPEHFELTRLNIIQNEPNEDEEMLKNETNEEPKEEKLKPNAKKDLKNIVFIFIIYLLQSIPFGLLTSIPMILQSRKSSYSDQGLISFAFWPHAFKILWAPLLDSFYIKRLGRRKSWIVIFQILIAIVALSSANYLNKILDIESSKTTQGKLFEFKFLNLKSIILF